MIMLPNKTASSMPPKRRTNQHQRQQSLEVPLLANHGQNLKTHRRGLSLDQRMNVMNVPSGSRPLPQDTNPPFPGPGPLARTTLDTNTGYTLDQQHYIKQVTQQHSLAQPGLSAPLPLQAPNLPTQLQQQLNGILAPAPSMEQAAAMQDLQNHLMWYQQNFGNTTNNAPIQGVPIEQTNAHTAGGDAALSISGIPPRTVSHTHSQTVPNTPQSIRQGWSSPPATHAKPRSQSFQSEHGSQGCLLTPNVSFSTESFTLTSDSDYASSNYSSSIADPSSPAHQHSTSLPTLFEEPCTPMIAHRSAIMGEPILIPIDLKNEPDFNSPDFMIGGARTARQEQALLDAAGIEADYIDPGISDEELFSYLNHPTTKNGPYTCKFEGCNAKVNRKENARSHVQNHLNIRPWHCRLCDKAFCRMHDTKRHHLTHTQERPAVCPCGKTFARADALTRHRQRDMCEGVLPGFEKIDKPKPKRGRPRKDRSQEDAVSSPRKSTRPGMGARIQKAKLARAMDAAHHQQQHFGSDSSDVSDRSLPNTPPQDSDAMDTDNFMTMQGGDAHFSNTLVNHTWLNTPPTSPLYKTDFKDNKLFLELMSNQPSIPSSPTHHSPHSHPSLEWPSSPIQVSHASHPRRHHATAISECDFLGSSPPCSATDLFSDATNPSDFDLLSAHSSSGVNTADVFSPRAGSCSGTSIYQSDLEPVQSTLHHDAAAVVNKSRNNGSQARQGISHMSTASGLSSGDLPVLGAGPDDHPVTGATDVFGHDVDDFLQNDQADDQYNEIRDFLDNWVN